MRTAILSRRKVQKYLHFVFKVYGEAGTRERNSPAINPIKGARNIGVVNPRRSWQGQQLTKTSGLSWPQHEREDGRVRVKRDWQAEEESDPRGGQEMEGGTDSLSLSLNALCLVSWADRPREKEVCGTRQAVWRGTVQRARLRNWSQTGRRIAGMK